MDEKKLTVKQFREFLNPLPPETKITFGSSKYSQRPLVLNKPQKEGNTLYIHLLELDENCENDKKQSEHELRETASSFLKTLNQYSDDTVIDFASTMSDGSPLEFNNISTVVAIDLVQTKTPEWKLA